MSQANSRDPVDEMWEAIEDKHAAYWLMPIVVAIDAHGKGTALDWAIALVRGKLRDVAPERRALLEHWLTELDVLKSAPPDWEHLCRRSRQIWYHAWARDTFQTVISRLYEALGGLVEANHAGYLKATAMAVAVLVSDTTGEPIREKIEEMVQSYHVWIRDP